MLKTTKIYKNNIQHTIWIEEVDDDYRTKYIVWIETKRLNPDIVDDTDNCNLDMYVFDRWSIAYKYYEELIG